MPTMFKDKYINADHLEPRHIANLEKLADYLSSLRVHPTSVEFDMGTFCEGYDFRCPTAACAFGHTWEALDIPRPALRPIWSEVGATHYGISWSDEDSIIDHWLFSGSWRVYDNSPFGAAVRIWRFLLYGVPADFYGDGDSYDFDYEPFTRNPPEGPTGPPPPCYDGGVA